MRKICFIILVVSLLGATYEKVSDGRLRVVESVPIEKVNTEKEVKETIAYYQDKISEYEALILVERLKLYEGGQVEAWQPYVDPTDPTINWDATDGRDTSVNWEDINRIR